MRSLVLIAAGIAAGGTLLIAVFTLGGGGTASAADPTCSGVLDVAVHGQHVVGDYVTGIGRDKLGWPPSGIDVGEAVAGEGVAIKGGPGPGFHFEHGFAAGASFCLAQAKSPGFHAGS